MTDWNKVILNCMIEQYPTGRWDVLRGVDAPEMAICMAYPCMAVAVAALQTAGFGATRFPVPAPELDGPYDLRTTLRFSAGEGRDVILVRHLQP